MKNIYIKFFVLLFIILGRTELGFSKEDPQKKPISSNKKESNSTIALKQDAQNELNTALNNFNASLSSTQTTVIDKMEDIDLDVSALAEENRSKAQKTMAYLDQNPDKVKAFLSFEDLVTFPVGFKQKLADNSEVTVGIFSVEFDQTGASCTFFIRLRTKIDDYSQGSSERDMLFGVSGIKFTKQGGMSGEIKAGLLGDFTIPGKNWTVKLIGGGDNISSPDLGKTYVKFTCDKFQEAKVSAEVVFPRNVVVPYDVTTGDASPTGRYSFLASAMVKKGFRDMILELSSLPTTPFAVAGFTKYGFKISGAVLDMSDLNDSPNAPANLFPPGYTNPDLDGSGSWRGVFLNQIAVVFPKQFEKDNPADLTKIEINSLIVDRTGFTGKAVYSSSTGLVFAAQKWQFSMKTFGIEFLQNKFVAGGFAGDFYTPINGSPTEEGSIGFGYASIIKANGDVSFTVNADAADVPIKCWKAKGKIYQGSQITMQVVNDKFYPSCNLSGELTIGANKINASDATDGHEIDATASFNGLVFENLTITTQPTFNVSIGNFRYLNSDNSKVAKIPVAITRLEKESTSPSNEIWIGIGFKVSLLKDKFSGSTDLTLRSYYDAVSGKLKLGSPSTGKNKISLNSLYVQGSTPAFSMVGYVEVFENKILNGINYGKGFDGKLMLALYKPFKVGIEADALFGRTLNNGVEYRYGNFSVYAGAPKVLTSPPGVKPVFEPAPIQSGDLGFKVPTGIGDLAINGLGLGVYFNMKPEFDSNIVGEIKYIPDNTIPFGFKIMLGIQNGAYNPPSVAPTFNGNVALDISLSSTDGINSIGIFGKATIAANLPFSNPGIGKLVDGKTSAELQNKVAVDHSQSGLLAKSSSIPDIKENKAAPTTSGIKIGLGILIDIPNKIAHAEAVVDVDQNGLTGIGPGGRAGKMVIHFEPNNSYIHLGKSPLDQRIGLKFQSNFEFGAYIMAGRGLTPFPLPPAEVISFFPSLKNSGRLTNPNFNNIIDAQGNAKGFAIGAHVKANIDLDGWLGYIKGYGVGGFDLMISKGSICSPNNWLGQAQIYGVADVDAGLGRQKLFRGAVGFYLTGQGLSPFGAKGDVCVTYGRKNKKLCLSFKSGTTCI
jgi:hypothetical protein